jgi:hypothetical protein
MRGLRVDMDAGSTLLVVFVALFPLVFIPGALFSSPSIIDDTVRAQAMEQFFFLPKLIVLCVFGLLALLESRKQSWRSVWVSLLIAHLALVIFSALNAHDTITYVLLGGQQRMDGVIYQVALVLAGVFAYQTFARDRNGISRMLIAFVGAGAVQAVLVVVQQLGLDPVATFVRWKAFGAPGGSIGHPGMVAGLLLPGIIVALWSYLNARTQQSKIWWAVAAVLLTVGLSVVSNRTALLGLGVGLLFVILQRRSLEVVGVSALLLIVVLFARNAIPSPTAPTRDLVSTQTLETRRMIWPLALQTARATPGQPFIGGGPDAFRLWVLRSKPLEGFVPLLGLELGWPSNARVAHAEVVQFPDTPVRDSVLRVKFAQYGNQRNITNDYPITLDRAHDLTLDRLVAYGGLSTLVWLVLYFFPLLRPMWNALAPGRTKAAENRNLGLTNNPLPVLSRGLIGAVLVLCVYYLAWFPVMQVEPLHLILLAAAWVAVLSHDRVKT